MSKSKTKKKKMPAKKKQKSEGIPLVVFMSMMGGGIVGYLGGEMAFYLRPHPAHWTVAFVGILLGSLIGLIIYRQRGDII